jgi:hypothetical protein
LSKLRLKDQIEFITNLSRLGMLRMHRRRRLGG